MIGNSCCLVVDPYDNSEFCKPADSILELKVVENDAIHDRMRTDPESSMSP